MNGMRWMCGMAVSLGLVFTTVTFASGEEKAEPKPEFPEISKVVEKAKKIEGFFTLYQHEDQLYMEIPSSMFEKTFLLNLSVARGTLSGLIGPEDMVYWKKVGKRMFLMRENVEYTAQKGHPLESAVEAGFMDEVKSTIPIKGKEEDTYLIDLSDLLIGSFPEMAQIPVPLDRNKATWGKIKNYPQNTEIEVGPVEFSQVEQHGDHTHTTTYSRSIRFSFSNIPQSDYNPRIADNRIGYFLTAKKDYTLKGDMEPFVRYINRWNLKKADPTAEKSPPKKPIVFYIEKSVPFEYRPTVREGILEWNKAFEEAGIINAIEVRYQEEDAEWDAEDVRYNTIRWMTSDIGVAIGPSRVNPKTGEIYDADILVDSSWLSYFEWQYDSLIEEALKQKNNGTKEGEDEAVPVSQLLHGWNQQSTYPFLEKYTNSSYQCSFSQGMKRQMAVAAAASLVQSSTDERSKNERLRRFIHQGLKQLVSHEVGHTLGLRHNFKSSSMISFEKLNDNEYVEEHGLGGSVMDYNEVNIAAPGETQGYYYSPTLGKWDYLAIQYGYTEISGDENKPLKDIAAIASTSPYLYGTDGDAYAGVDPQTYPYNLSDNQVAFAKRRVAVIHDIWKNLVDRIVGEGEGYQKARNTFLFTLFDMTYQMYHPSRIIGGIYINRDQKGDPEEDPNLIMVSADEQRDALHFITENVFSDTAFQFDPDMVSRLAPNRWDHWGTNSSLINLPIHELIVSEQMWIARQLFHPDKLRRLHDSQVFVKAEDFFTIDEIYSTVTKAIWSEIYNLKSSASREWTNQRPLVSSIRRDLQREFLKTILLRQIISPNPLLPQDAQSMAWMTAQNLHDQISEIVESVSNGDIKIDPLSQAHLIEAKLRIAKALESMYQLN